jgi:hypothetical protein
MSECIDNQEVGLEAATLERVRNSLLVKCSGADDVTGLKVSTEAADSIVLRSSGRGAFPCRLKRPRQASRGGMGSENAGLSNERRVGNTSTVHPRFPE